MVITENYDIILPYYNDLHIKMEPLVKAVFILFLRHEEGIVFKCLSDYRDELKEIYLDIRSKLERPGHLSEERINQSIDALRILSLILSMKSVPGYVQLSSRSLMSRLPNTII